MPGRERKNGSKLQSDSRLETKYRQKWLYQRQIQTCKTKNNQKTPKNLR